MRCFFFASDKLVGVNADLLLVLGLALELDLAVNQSEEGVVLANTDIVAGMDGSTALSDNDIARNNGLTVSLLYAKTLRLTIAAVLSRTNTFFMCKELNRQSKHGIVLLSVKLFYDNRNVFRKIVLERF